MPDTNLAADNFVNLGGALVDADGQSDVVAVWEGGGDIAHHFLAVLTVSAHAGTTPTLDIDLEGSFDETNWFVLDSFAQVLEVDGTTFVSSGPGGITLPPFLRANYDVGGTDPEYTFDLWLAIS